MDKSGGGVNVDEICQRAKNPTVLSRKPLAGVSEADRMQKVNNLLQDAEQGETLGLGILHVALPPNGGRGGLMNSLRSVEFAWLPQAQSSFASRFARTTIAKPNFQNWCSTKFAKKPVLRRGEAADPQNSAKANPIAANITTALLNCGVEV